ncbi:serine protease subtilisin family protein [Lachnospiraceae bacterium]|nr:serine protease subtilisin family protein [Lachnospiraceae bacterium]
MKRKKASRRLTALTLAFFLALGMTGSVGAKEKGTESFTLQSGMQNNIQKRTGEEEGLRKDAKEEQEKADKAGELRQGGKGEEQEESEKAGRLRQDRNGEEQEESEKTEKLRQDEKREEQEETGSAGQLQWEEETESVKAGIEAEPIASNGENIRQDAEEVRVFIVLEGESVLEQGFSVKGVRENEKAQDFSEEIRLRQGMVVEEIQQAVKERPLEVRYQFSLLSNAVSAVVEYGDIEKIQEVAGVKAVYVVPRYQLQENLQPATYTAGGMVGSYQTWDSGYTGLGQRIAIVDTGIDVSHPSFDENAFSYGRKMTKEKNGRDAAEELLNAGDISKVFARLNIDQKGKGVSPKALYRNEKIAYAYNYSGRNLDVSYESGDHGTHVAGIAAANQYVPDSKGGYQEQQDGVAGIAKDAQLLIMKVFDGNNETYTDDYMAAVEDALLLGADVVNLSMGTPNPGESKAFSGEEYVDGIFARLLKSDAVVSISAGNNGAWADASSTYHNRAEDVNMNMIGNPGSYTNALTVASAVNAGYSGYGFRFGKQTYFYEEAADNKNIASMASLAVNHQETSYEYVFLETYGKKQDYQGKNVKGKIVFVQKGGISYARKHEIAQDAGAKALFIYNSDLGYSKLSLADSRAVIPCAILGWADSWELSAPERESVISILPQPVSSREAAKGYKMSSFSAWGVPGDLSLKPEITAPGEEIYSAMDQGTYGCMSGTSMAAPSIAGMSALVSEYIKRSNLEEKTGLGKRALIQSLLLSTAVPLKEEDNEEYSPRKQGGGLANVHAATTTPAYLLVNGKAGNDGKVKAELGDDPKRRGIYEFSFSVYNISGKNQYYSLDSSILTEELLQEKWIAGSSHKLQPQVTFSSQNQVLFYDLNGDGKVNQEDAAKLLCHVNQSTLFERVERNQEKFDFHKDGVIDTADVYGFLKELQAETPSADFQEKVLEVKEQAQVSVKIELSAKDRNYLDNSFRHGMYVEGFVYLKGAVELSVPLLAFYGNWTESSMFEPFDYLQFYNGGKQEGMTYSDVNVANYLNYYRAEEERNFYYGSNLYLEGGDREYLPDRNAFSTASGDRIESAAYTLIRNAARIETSIVDDKTGKVYYQYQEENYPGVYYDSREGKWFNREYTSVLDWSGTDRQGKLLPEGTRVRFMVRALPEYYRDKPQKAADGAVFSVPLTIDNTKPKLLAMEDEGPGSICLKFRDNRYTAAVKVYDRDRETLLKAYSVNQKKPGLAVQITIKDPKKVFYLKLIDYAGNTAFYRVNRSGSADTSCTDGVTLDQSELKLIKRNTKRLKAVVSPEGVLDDTVTFRSENDSIAAVDQKGNVTGMAPGRTRIIATTNAKNAEGRAEIAVCQVTVEEIQVSLNGIIWNGDGKTWFGSVNTAKLPEYTKLSQIKKNRYYLAASAVEDKILAVEEAGEGSAVYLMDPARQYQTISKGNLEWKISDLAYSPNTNLVFSVGGTELNCFERENIYTVQGFVSVYDVTLGDKLMGITYAGSSNEGKYGMTDWFYVVTQSGKLYEMGYAAKSEEYVYKNILKEVGNTGISTGEEESRNSLYYEPDSGYIFWSVYDRNHTASLYAVSCKKSGKEHTVDTYYLGDFPEGAWPFVFTSGTSGLDGYSFVCRKEGGQ